MGKPRHYWYGNVRKMVMRYPELKQEKSKMAKSYVKAIETTLETTEKMELGDYRIKAIKLVYFDKTHTIDGASLVLHYSSSTVVRWLNKFVNDVGLKVGF